MLLTGCATATSATDTAVCAGWKPITHSKRDTPETAKQVREHNLFGIRRGCWPAGPAK